MLLAKLHAVYAYVYVCAPHWHSVLICLVLWSGISLPSGAHQPQPALCMTSGLFEVTCFNSKTALSQLPLLPSAHAEKSQSDSEPSIQPIRCSHNGNNQTNTELQRLIFSLSLHFHSSSFLPLLCHACV